MHADTKVFIISIVLLIIFLGIGGILLSQHKDDYAYFAFGLALVCLLIILYIGIIWSAGSSASSNMTNDRYLE
jgi:uncharacterized membrane protein SirB2